MFIKMQASNRRLYIRLLMFIFFFEMSNYNKETTNIPLPSEELLKCEHITHNLIYLN